MEKQLQLVTFEQAKRLKQLGFDWECDYVYNLIRNPFKIPIKSNGLNRTGVGYMFDCPTVALALKWFRDVKKLRFSVCYMADKYFYTHPKTDDNRLFDTYEQAESALLDELLKIVE